MAFAEKLRSLMAITGLSNIKLAKEMNIDPSVVSRWKNGVRSPGANPHTVNRLGNLFAAHITAHYQREMLTKLTGSNLVSPAGHSEIQEAVKQWLMEDSPVFQGLVSRAQPAAQAPPPARQQGGKLEEFFRRLAESCCEDGVLRIYCDEDAAYVENAAALLRAACEEMPCLAGQITSVRLVVNANLMTEEIMKQVELTLPFMHTGYLQMYSLHRQHRDVFRHFMMVARGVGVFTSVSFDGGPPALSLQTGQAVTEEHARRFDRLAESCPALLSRPRTGLVGETLDETLEFLKLPGDLIAMGNLLPNILLPPQMLAEIITAFDGAAVGRPLGRNSLEEVYAALTAHLRRHTLLACLPLYTPEEVEAGAAGASAVPHFLGRQPVLTPARYLAVLRNLLAMLGSHKNLKLQIIPPLAHEYTSMLKPDALMYVTTSTPQVKTYMCDRPALIHTLYDHIMRKYGALPAAQRDAGRNREQLLAHIALFEQHLAGVGQAV